MYESVKTYLFLIEFLHIINIHTHKQILNNIMNDINKLIYKLFKKYLKTYLNILYVFK